MTPLPKAIFSDDRMYRYILTRTWDTTKPYIIFVGLNPSTADETEDDNTIKKLVRYSKRWGYGGIIMTNIFAFRATQPKDMKKAEDPIGPDNDRYLCNIISSGQATTVVAMWGNHGVYKQRGERVKQLLNEMEFKGYINLKCFEISKQGQPKHPLFLSETLDPISF